ncbi:hypothetical protein [Peptostreptococcus anaerobius]|uniref:hypothetical protein n=1 Tax=Peptostreptococcus anaerobius TaxID=1261 RepID=UPI0029000192|nr:hypothetical protein [Peptostreptococcus anaerobius]MDU1598244.1 hypothetical protein [Peptostreptococcus anaerobius]MDU1681819.1 hypothetical protein [Peptostreptococcus anaerobius]
MLKSLRQINLYPTARIDRAFKIKAGETARGIRLVVKDMDLKDLKFKNYIKIENKLFENEAIEIDSKNRFVDIYFPSLDSGAYQSELLIYDDDKLLKSGTYIIDVGESIIVGEADKLKEINGDQLLIFIENFKVTAAEILKKLDTVEKRYNDILQDISEKAKGNDGKSAYEVWLEKQEDKTQSIDDFLNSLKAKPPELNFMIDDAGNIYVDIEN